MEKKPILTEEQNHLLSSIKKEIQNKQFICIGGYAGSGKSTCLSELTNAYPNFAVCAFTGKAANVLRKKGIGDAATIHSTIYHVEEDYKGNPKFYLKPKNKIDFRGFFIDEASMISEELFSDIMSFDLPVVFFGDHGQLEPVGSSFNLMKKPHYKLETIHRNANSIAKFADFLRKGNSAIEYSSDDRVKLVAKKTLKNELLADVDQIICGFNRTRISFNKRIREHLGYEDVLVKGERIICLKNNKTLNIFNGMQGTVKTIKKNKVKIQTDNGFCEIPIDQKQFNQEKLLEAANSDRETGFFDYSYAITTHKAQGDEWDKVLVYEEKCDLWSHERWAYTAASRAKEMLYWAV